MVLGKRNLRHSAGPGRVERAFSSATGVGLAHFMTCFRPRRDGAPAPRVFPLKARIKTRGGPSFPAVSADIGPLVPRIQVVGSPVFAALPRGRRSASRTWDRLGEGAGDDGDGQEDGGGAGLGATGEPLARSTIRRLPSLAQGLGQCARISRDRGRRETLSVYQTRRDVNQAGQSPNFVVMPDGLNGTLNSIAELKTGPTRKINMDQYRTPTLIQNLLKGLCPVSVLIPAHSSVSYTQLLCRCTLSESAG